MKFGSLEADRRKSLACGELSVIGTAAMLVRTRFFDAKFGYPGECANIGNEAMLCAPKVSLIRVIDG